MCKARGGHLAQIKSQAEQDLIVGLCPNKKCPWTWIGLNDIAKEGTFIWNDGSALDFKNWHKGEPNNAGGKEDCGHIWHKNQWNDIKCDHKMNFVCEKYRACPEGWVLSPTRGVCFGSDIKTKETYADATKMCKARGGHLAQIKSQAEQDLIVGLCPNKKCPWTWIGLNDIAKEGTFIWNDGS